MRNVRVILLLSLAVLARPALAQKRVSAIEAKDHVGEVATVCGEVASTHYAPSTKGQPAVSLPCPRRVPRSCDSSDCCDCCVT